MIEELDDLPENEQEISEEDLHVPAELLDLYEELEAEGSTPEELSEFVEGSQ